MSTVIFVKSPEKLLNVEGKKRRSTGKVLNLAATYGMQSKAAGEKLGYTGKEAEEQGEKLLHNFFKGFPAVYTAIEESKKFLAKHGYVEDFVGRRRHLPEYFLPKYDITYSDKRKAEAESFNPLLDCEDRSVINNKMQRYLDLAKETKGNAAFDKLKLEAAKEGYELKSNTGIIARTERQCFNARIQSSAATLTKLAMIDIFNDVEMNYYQAKLIIPVHDELLVECPKFYGEQVLSRLPEIMVNAAKKAKDDIPQKCDGYLVHRWYADEQAANIRAFYEKAVSNLGDKKKALEQVFEEFEEFPEDALEKVCHGETDDLIFSE